MEIIGLSGFARSGKDEAARVLVEEHGFIQVAFADKLRDMLYALNPVVAHKTHMLKVRTPEKVVSLYVDDETPATVDLPVYLQQVIDTYGWGGYKETEYSAEIRRLLQRLGTEAGRQTLWDSIWIDAALAGLPDNARVVVSDARFFNEFDAIRDRGGDVWRIEREGIGPANDHASEMEAVDYPNFSIVIHNDGTLEEYHKKIQMAFSLYVSARSVL